MKSYTSNNYYLTDYLAALFIPIIITVTISYFLRENTSSLTICISIIVLLALITFLLIKKLTKIEFQDNFILVIYKFSRKKIQIKYSEIIELKHISAYSGTSRNVIKYQQKGIKQITITSVLSDNDFQEFIVWLNKKNNKINFTFLPGDSIVKERYLKDTPISI